MEEQKAKRATGMHPQRLANEKVYADGEGRRKRELSRTAGLKMRMETKKPPKYLKKPMSMCLRYPVKMV